MKIDRKVKNISFNQDREFGVEIEISGFSITGIKKFYNELPEGYGGLELVKEDRLYRLQNRDSYSRKQILKNFLSDYTGFTVNSEYYQHSLGNDVDDVNSNKMIWTLKDDSSVSGAGLELISGNASNVLSGDQGLNELFIITEALKVARAKVNSTTGLHVHHSNRNLKMSHQNQIINLYNGNSIAISSILPNSRINNSYAAPVDSNYINRIQGSSHLNDFRTQSENHVSRYSSINFTEVTVEFRQHSGTTEFEKIKNWIVFTQAIINESIRRVSNKKHDNRFQVDMSYKVQLISKLLSNRETKELMTKKMIDSLIRESVRQMMKSLKVKYVSTHMTPRDEHTNELGDYLNKRVKELTLKNNSKRLFSNSHESLNNLEHNSNSKTTNMKKDQVQESFDRIKNLLQTTDNVKVSDLRI